MEVQFNELINTYLNGNIGDFKAGFEKFSSIDKDTFIVWLYNTALDSGHLLNKDSVLKMYKFLLRWLI